MSKENKSQHEEHEEHEFNEVVRVMESVEGYKFPETTLGKVLNSWDDTFSGLNLLKQPKPKPSK